MISNILYRLCRSFYFARVSFIAGASLLYPLLFVWVGTRKNDLFDMKIAQRFREQISQVCFYNDGNEISMTISVGVAQCNGVEESMAAILGRADSSGYPAKKVNVDKTMIILSPVFGKTI